MKLDNLLVEVRNAALERVGTIVPDDLDLDAEILTNDVGTWTCAIARTHPLADELSTPGAGIIVTDTETSEIVFSGPAVEPVEAESTADLGSTVTVTGVTDDVILDDMLCFPDPAVADPALQSKGGDFRKGKAETVMHYFVNVNVGPEAVVERRNPRLTMGEDEGRGKVVGVTARFDNLLALLQETAAHDDITFRVVQVGDVLEFQTTLPVAVERTVRLSAADGGLVSSRFTASAPGVTRAIVGGAGGNTSRKVRQVTSDAAEAAEEDWGRRIERFIDRQDARGHGDMKRAGREAMAREGRATETARIEPNDRMRDTFGSEWNLGNTVTVESRGRDRTAPVSGIIIKANKNRLRVGALLGDSDKFRGKKAKRRKKAVGDDGLRVPKWEDTDPYTLTEDDVAAGEFTHSLRCRPIMPRSVQVAQDGRLVRPRDIEVENGPGRLTVKLNGTEQTGDEYDLHYQHYGERDFGWSRPTYLDGTAPVDRDDPSAFAVEHWAQVALPGDRVLVVYCAVSYNAVPDEDAISARARVLGKGDPPTGGPVITLGSPGMHWPTTLYDRSSRGFLQSDNCEVAHVGGDLYLSAFGMNQRDYSQYPEVAYRDSAAIVLMRVTDLEVEIVDSWVDASEWGPTDYASSSFRIAPCEGGAVVFYSRHDSASAETAWLHRPVTVSESSITVGAGQVVPWDMSAWGAVDRTSWFGPDGRGAFLTEDCYLYPVQASLANTTFGEPFLIDGMDTYADAFDSTSRLVDGREPGTFLASWYDPSLENADYDYLTIVEVKLEDGSAHIVDTSLNYNDDYGYGIVNMALPKTVYRGEVCALYSNGDSEYDDEGYFFYGGHTHQHEGRPVLLRDMFGKADYDDVLEAEMPKSDGWLDYEDNPGYWMRDVVATETGLFVINATESTDLTYAHAQVGWVRID